MSAAAPSDRDRLGSEEIAQVIECLRTGWLTMGPRTEQFERELAGRMRVEHALALSTGTAALQLAFMAAAVGPGDEVVLGALARPAAAQAATMTGAELRFADVVSPAEPWVDAAAVAEQLTERTRVVVATHLWGYSSPISPIRELCDARGIVMVEDATEALGARVVRGSPGTDGTSQFAGTVGHIGCLSLASGTQLGVGRGGVLVTSDDRFAATTRLLRSHGLTSTTWDRHRGHAASYDVVEIGFNYRFDEPRAALALARLGGLDDQIERRRAADRRYRERIFPATGSEPCFPSWVAREAAPLAFPVLAADSSSRAAIADRLTSAGIQAPGRVAQGSETRGPRATPMAEQLARRVLVLPLRPWAQEREQECVLAAVRRATSPSCDGA